MASLIHKPNDRWAIQFRLFARDKHRRTVYLGQATEEQAKAIRQRIEVLVRAIRADSPPDRSTAAWAAKLDDTLYGKLAHVGLVVPRAGQEDTAPVPLLARFLDEYIAKRTDVKGSTATVYGHTRRCLVEFFGATRPLDRISPGEVDDFRRRLGADRKTGGQGLASNTVARRCGIAKQFFHAAVKHRLIAENPFADVGSCSIREVRDRDYFITRDEAAKVLDVCPNAQWRLLFALSRFGGLRCPSEHLALEWAHVDWERSRMTVHSPKTEHHEGKGSRVVPIFRELCPYLDEAWALAEEGARFVITRYRDKTTNLRTQLTRIIEKAGLKPWPKLWQNLRATRETELNEEFPIQVVCAWIGNSPAIARKHYLQVTDDHFARALAQPAAPDPGDDPNRKALHFGQDPNTTDQDSNRKALQSALHSGGARACKAVQEDSDPSDATPYVASPCTYLHEPAFPSVNAPMGDSRLERLTSTL